jgi:diguanylate cyclase (GGDEF)-like protein
MGQVKTIVWRRIFEGLVLATGAPLGWLAIRALQGHSPVEEIVRSPGLYVYLTVPTMLAFALFGFVIGLHEARLEEAKAGLEKTSVTDELTDLRNLRYFRARLFEEDALARRTGSVYALVIFDLDHFKRVNDKFGHLTGDKVLIAVARALGSVSRQADTAARVGGEEFALLLPQTDCAEAATLAERVRAEIGKQTINTGQTSVSVTASAGVASSQDLIGSSPDALYAAADDALYRAKRAGRNRVVVAEPGRAHAN